MIRQRHSRRIYFDLLVPVASRRTRTRDGPWKHLSTVLSILKAKVDESERVKKPKKESERSRKLGALERI